LDESPDMSYTVQLAVFFPGIDMEFHVNEELADLIAMKGTTTGADYMKSEEDAAKYGYPDTETVWTADRWSVEYGREEQWRVFACNQRHEEYNCNLIIRHFSIHQKSFCDKSFKISTVVTVVS
jgi:hypothetical protein